MGTSISGESMMEPMAPEFQFSGGPDFATQAPLRYTFAGIG